MEDGSLMFLYKNRIVITGGTGRFGQELKRTKNKYQLFFPSKSQLNILKKKIWGMSYLTQLLI